MRYGCLRHSRVRHIPVIAAIGRNSHSTPESIRITSLPHLGTRQIVRARERAPDYASYLRIESDPVGGVLPAPGNAGDRTAPGCSRVRAFEQAYIGIGNEHVLYVERVEVDAVAGCDIEACGRPAVLGDMRGDDLFPALAA